MRPETLHEEMKRYVRFSDQDAALLAELRGHASPSFGRIAIEFYDRIREHEGAHRVLKDEAQIERLKLSLVRWLERLLGGTYDGTYFAESAKIGRVHVRVGLPQHYMFTAMALIRVALLDIARRSMPERAAEVESAVLRVIDLELAIMLETYNDDLASRAKRADRMVQDGDGRTVAQTAHAYEHAVELAKAIFVGLDAAGTIQLFNAEAERVTGYGREEVIGTRFVDSLLPPEIAAEHAGSFIPGGAPAPEMLESAVRTKSGALREVRWQLAPSPHPEGRVVLFAVGLDVTEERGLMARLVQSEKLAAVGTLAAGLAHEIRNPLNGAHLHVTFLERGLEAANVTDPDALDAVRVVRDEITRLAQLVTEFLEFARPHPLARKPTTIGAVCRRVGLLTEPDAAAQGSRLELDMPDADIEIDADAQKLEQVLINLIRNAVDAMAPAGGGRVVLRARKQPRVVVIEVEDEGSGLSDPKAPIFDPFFTTKAGGTGLGLAIVHRIVTDHGGTIDFTSRAGYTCFRVRLPLPGWDTTRKGAAP
jgi:PAS domain S-box-containing protein